jgi:hypothetical protein
MRPPEDFKALWRNAPEEIAAPDLVAIRKAARRFQRRKALAHAVEYVAAAVVIVILGWYLRIFDAPLMRAASGLGILWAVFYAWQRHRLITTRPLPEDAAACLDFHRRELARQRDVVRGAWRWTLAPAAVVMGLMLLSRWIEFQPPGAPPWRLALMIGASVLFVVTNLVLVALWFQHRADKLQDQIDDLDRMGGTP